VGFTTDLVYGIKHWEEGAGFASSVLWGLPQSGV